MNLDQQVEFYNDYWKDLNKFGSYKLKRISEIVKLLDLAKKYKKPAKILDLGCGDGRCCAIWNEVADTSGLDLSSDAMKIASKRYPFIDFKQGDATKTSYADKSFDLIVSQEVIEHIEIQSSYVDECKRLLSDKGLLILTTPNKYYFDRRKGGNYSNQPIENILCPKQLKKLLSEDFNILKLYTIINPKGDYGVYKLLSNRLVLSAVSLFKLSSFYSFLLSKFNLGLNLIVLAQKK